MLPPRWQPLGQLVVSRMREFIREPHAIFWVYGFPLLLAMTLGFAFRGVEPMPPHVDVQDGPDTSKANVVMNTLAAAKIKVEMHDHEDCEKRLSRAKTVLYVIPHADGYEYVFDPANDDGSRARYWVEALLSRSSTKTLDKDTLPSAPGGRYVHRLVPALIATNIMGGGLFGLGFVLVDMRVRKLFKRLLATPLRHSDFLLAMVISRMLFLLPEMTCLFVVGIFLFGVPMYGSFFTLIPVIAAGAAAFAGIGLMIGSRTEKTEVASGLINLVMLPQYIMSGVFFSSSNFPDAAQPFIKALPLTQLIDAVREIMLEGKDLWDVSGHIVILAAYAAVTFTLALRWFKWR